MSHTIEAVGMVPIGNFKWDAFDQHKQKIIDLCLAQEKPNTIESKVGTNIKQNLWESKFTFLEDHEELAELRVWFNEALSYFTSTVNKVSHAVAIKESWAHVTRPHGWHGPHRHPYSIWSGIFYVDADQIEGSHNTFFNHFNMPRIPGYEFWEEQFDINFNPGTLVIFPSTMMHYAPPYLGNDRRIVISFNSLVMR